MVPRELAETFGPPCCPSREEEGLAVQLEGSTEFEEQNQMLASARRFACGFWTWGGLAGWFERTLKRKPTEQLRFAESKNP